MDKYKFRRALEQIEEAAGREIGPQEMVDCFGCHTTHASSGGKLQLEATERQDSTTCYVNHDGGGQRTVQLAGTKRSGTHRQNLSFSGDATVSCTRTVTAYTGSGVGRRDFSRSGAFRGGAVALVVVPLVFLGVIRVLRIAARG